MNRFGKKKLPDTMGRMKRPIGRMQTDHINAKPIVLKPSPALDNLRKMAYSNNNQAHNQNKQPLQLPMM